jgi:hypothetical protein
MYLNNRHFNNRSSKKMTMTMGLQAEAEMEGAYVMEWADRRYP